MRCVGFDSETLKGEPMTLQFWGEKQQDIYAVNESTAEETFLRALEKYATNDNTLTTIFCHHLAFDILSAFPKRLGEFADGYFNISSRGWDISGVFGRPTFARASKDRRRILIVDTGKFCRQGTSLVELAESYCPDLPKLRMPIGLGTKKFSVRDSSFVSYAMRDAEIAYRFGKIIAGWHEKYDIQMSLSGPHMAAQVFRRHYVQDIIPLAPRAICYQSIRAYHGGIQRAPWSPNFWPDINCIDIVSAYPHAMHSCPSFTNPRLYRTLRASKGRVPDFGVYRVKGFAKQDPHCCLFDAEFRSVHGEFDIYSTGFEINRFLSLKGGSISKVTGWYYDAEKDNAHRPMRAYVDNFFTMKSTAENKTERESAKLLLNSLYGKFIQTRVEEEPYYDVQADELITDTTLRAGGLFNPFIAACITGHTRSRLCLLEHEHTAVHSATDGIIASKKNTRAIKLGTKLGDLSIEASGDALIVRPKLYIIYSDTTKLRQRDSNKLLKSEVRRGERTYISKYALHGFRGRVGELEHMLKKGVTEYQYTHVVGLRESLKTKLGRANNFIQREGKLNVDLP